MKCPVEAFIHRPLFCLHSADELERAFAARALGLAHKPRNNHNATSRNAPEKTEKTENLESQWLILSQIIVGAQY